MSSHLQPQRKVSYRMALIYTLALACACSLSIGAHFARDTLGPLKTKLGQEMGTNNAQFSLLMAAFSLNSTWTPLVGGLLTAKIGIAFTSILATGSIFFGQLLLLIGTLMHNVKLMILGMFIYGLGVSPLAVVQETIIVRFFRSRGLGLSMAIGLLAGKIASFVGARISFSLSERYGLHAPITVATILSAFSLVINLVYLSLSSWIATEVGINFDDGESQQRRSDDFDEASAVDYVARKSKVHLRDVVDLGDVFWAYVALNVFCGTIWSPFNHLAANIFEQRYHLSQATAGKYASYLLAGSIVLYPTCGIIVDRVKGKGIAMTLFLASSSCTLLCYAWLATPPSITQTPLPAIILYGLALGYSPLLLAVIVPQLVPSRYVPTALGAHKSAEKIGETIFQTFAGLVLDKSPGRSPSTSPAKSIQHLLNLFVMMNILHLSSATVLRWTHRLNGAEPGINSGNHSTVDLTRHSADSEYSNTAGSDVGESSSLLSDQTSASSTLEQAAIYDRPRQTGSDVRRRGVWFARMSITLAIFAWALFIGTAVARIH